MAIFINNVVPRGILRRIADINYELFFSCLDCVKVYIKLYHCRL